MDAYERNVDRALNAVEKTAKTMSGVRAGCIMLVSNLFFAAFCLWGAYAAYTSWQLQNTGEHITGSVVRLEESSSAESGCCVYSPVIEYQINGQTYSIEGGNASNPPAYKVGQQVNLIYNPADPAKAQIDRFSERWLFPIIIIPAMIFGALIVDFFMIRAWRRGDEIFA